MNICSCGHFLSKHDAGGCCICFGETCIQYEPHPTFGGQS